MSTPASLRSDCPGRTTVASPGGSRWNQRTNTAGTSGRIAWNAQRTVGSWLAQSGSSLHLVGRVLGHTVPATTAIYSRFAEDHVKAALDAHAKRLLGVAGKLPAAEVVDIAEARDKSAP
jgi:hypothetical protein